MNDGKRRRAASLHHNEARPRWLGDLIAWIDAGTKCVIGSVEPFTGA